MIKLSPSLSDKLNLIRKLGRPVRMWNSTKLLASYYLSRLFRTNLHSGLPVAMSIEPTTSCNLRCPQCPSGLRSFSRPTGMLSADAFQTFLNQTSPHLGYLTLYFQGEPYLNPDFLDMVKMASDKHIYTATSTNAHYLDEKNARATILSGLDRLIISVDGTDQETYKHYRVGGQLDKVLSGTRNLVAQKKALRSSTPLIIWQFVVFRHNEHQVEEIKKLGREIGVDQVSIKTAQVYDYENGENWIPVNNNLSRYRKNGDSYSLANPILNHCWRMWHSCVITWDGSIVPCCFDKDGSHSLGSLGQMNFREIWTGSAYRRFRESLLRGRDQIEICRNCTEGAKVWAE